jgi:multidrug efflux pump
MYWFWKFFIQQSKFSFLLMLSLIGFGIFAIIAIPKESNPEVIVPVGFVVTTLPGASATDIESLITDKIEQGIEGNLTDLKKMTSTSQEGVSSVVFEFEADANVDDSIQELKNEIDKIKSELPTDAEDPFVSEVDFVDQPIVTVAVSGDVSDAEFADLADTLETELERIQNVSRAEVSGVRTREVTIIIDQTLLSRYDLTLNEVVSVIQRSNATFPVGSITTEGIAYNIAFEGDIAVTAAIPDLPVAVRGGQPVYVRDIAVVEDGYKEANSLSRLSLLGEPTEKSISLSIFKGKGGDITRISREVEDRIIGLQEPGELLEGLTAVLLLDSGEQITKELGRLVRSGVSTILLVMLLLIFTIGLREGLIAAAAIPLSFTIGFIGLLLSGNTINFVSLFALILAVGILVDSAIVMIEGINRRMKESAQIDKTEAALLTIKEFNIPLTTGTLTTIAMFSGLFLVGGISGQFISAIPFTVNFILAASLLVALGFIPLIAAIFLRRRTESKMDALQQKYSRKLEKWYRGMLESFLMSKKKKIIFVSTIMIGFFIALSLPFVGLVKVTFFEQSDIDWIFAEIEMQQGTQLTTTDIVSRRVEEILYNNPDIESFTTTVGSSAEFSSNSGSQSGAKLANFFITLRSDRTKTSTVVVEDLQKSLSVIKEGAVTIGQPSDGPPTGAAIVVRLLGDDLEELTIATLRAAEFLKTIPGATSVETSTNNNSTEFVFTLNKAKAIALGLDPFSVSQTLRTAVYGTEATSITTSSDDIDVIVKLALNANYLDSGNTSDTTIDTLENLTLQLQNGESVLLSSIVETSLRESSSVISHEGGQRILNLSGDVTSNANAREVNAEFLSRVRIEAQIPDNITISTGGENEESNEAFQDMFYALIVGVLLMLAVLVLQFNSYRHTFYVLSILPFSLIGIMLGLSLTQLPLSFPSIMGFVALSGIVVNNSILLIDQMNNNRRRNPKKTLQNNVIDAAVSRLRPILLTTLTTVVGIYPLTYASDLWSPLAWAVMFGLSFSVVITLLLIPIIYNRKPGDLS